MSDPFVGSEAVASGDLVKSALRTRHTRLFRDVYGSPGCEASPLVKARAGWLWSRRKGIIAGLTASAMYGAKWVDPSAPLEILHTNRNPLPGIRVHGDRITEEEVSVIDGIPVTTAARTVLDLGCWYPLEEAVMAIDSLMAAADLKAADVELLAGMYPGRRGIRCAREALGLADSGSQSPKETWLRLLLVGSGFPCPQTQIPVYDEFGMAFAYLDMGWEDIQVAAEYDGEQHRTDRRQYRWDIRRQEKIERRGWKVIRVVAGDQPADIVGRVAAARAQRLPR